MNAAREMATAVVVLQVSVPKSVTEMADTGEDHGYTEAVGGGDHILIFH